MKQPLAEFNAVFKVIVKGNSWFIAMKTNKVLRN